MAMGDFRKRVLEAKEDVSEKDILTSKGALDYITSLVGAVMKKFNDFVQIKLFWDCSGTTAYATGNHEINVNVNNDFISSQKTLVDKMVMLKGVVLHEVGHLLFTDFHLMKSEQEVFMKDGKLFPVPQNSAIWDADASKMSSMVRAKWFEIWHGIQNRVEDGFIEFLILNLVPGDGQCLQKLRDYMISQSTSVKTMEAEGGKPLQILYNLILYYAKFHIADIDQDDEDKDYIKVFRQCQPIIDNAVHEQRSFERNKLINEIFCFLYEFMKSDEQDQKKDQDEDDSNSNDSGNNESNENNESNSGNSSKDEDEKNDSDDSKQNSSENQNTEEHNDESQSNNQDSDSSSEQNGSETDDSNGNSNDGDTIPSIDVPKDTLDFGDKVDSSSVLNDNNFIKENPESSENKAEIPSAADKMAVEKIKEGIAEENVKSQIEKELGAELQQEANETSYSNENKNLEIQVSREFPSELSKKRYEQVEPEVKGEVKRLVREIKNKIKDRQEGGKLNGLYMGRQMDMHSLYRYDGRVLCKNNLPEDIPHMAISIIIDASGSMGNTEKKMSVVKTSLLVYEFCQKLHIPVCVYSHNVNGCVCVYALADYASVDGNDKYRICDYDPLGCNRDGMAIDFASARLSKRPEETKICFIVSDGLPSDYCSREEGIKDIYDTLEKYEKKGVKYISCGIGCDAKEVQEIYNGKREYLDCSEPNKLPVLIVRSIKNLIK